jgi:hypothetical protein
MARTRQDILDAYLADPQYATLTSVVNGVTVPLSNADRLTRLGEWADATLLREQEADAETARKDLRRQVRLALAALDADITTLQTTSPTLAQLRPMVLRADRVLVGVIRALIDLDLIERND